MRTKNLFSWIAIDGSKIWSLLRFDLLVLKLILADGNVSSDLWWRTTFRRKHMPPFSKGRIQNKVMEVKPWENLTESLNMFRKFGVWNLLGVNGPIWFDHFFHNSITCIIYALTRFSTTNLDHSNSLRGGLLQKMQVQTPSRFRSP